MAALKGKALKLYRSGKYREATEIVKQVLNMPL